MTEQRTRRQRAHDEFYEMWLNDFHAEDLFEVAWQAGYEQGAEDWKR